MDESSNMLDNILLSVKILLFLFLVIILIGNTVYTVKETESAVITTFGKATVNTKKGLQFKIPFLQKITKVDTTVKGFTIGFQYNEDGTTADVPEESVMITSDFNFINTDFYVSYTVTDPSE